MRKSLQSITLVIFFCLLSNAYSQSVGSYHIQNKVQVDRSDCADLSHLILMLPYAQTNQYQTVTNVNIYSGELLDIPETDDKYIRYTYDQSAINSLGNTIEAYYEFDIELLTIDFNFDQISDIYPYDTSSSIYKWYTGASGEYVVPDDTTIQRIGDEIWAQSTDLVDYARKCYEYVAANYEYLNPLTGLHTLRNILDNGGGDCGNLSSIYVSLLRNRGIPSRHIVTIRPDGNYHVWSDFYLESYGWIPVDVTYKQGHPDGDFFGKYDGNGIVVGKEVWINVERSPGETYYSSIMQSFHWWYWHGGGGCNSITPEHIVTSEEITKIENPSFNPLHIFPNPTKGMVYIHYTNNIIKNVSIVDITGQKIVEKELMEGNAPINVSNLDNGVYILSCFTEKDVFTTMIIKE